MHICRTGRLYARGRVASAGRGDETSVAASAAGTGGQAAGGFRSRLNLDTQESEASQMSPEHRAKIAAAMTGRTHSPEARARMSAAQKGHGVSPETRARIAAALKGRSGP